FKKYIFALGDVVLVICAYLVTFLFVEVQFSLPDFLQMMYAAVVTYLLAFLFFGIYRVIIRFASIKEYSTCCFACLVSAVVLCVARKLFFFPGTMRQHLLAAVFAAIFCVGIRVFVRMVVHYIVQDHEHNSNLKRLLIIGAGYAGNKVIKELEITTPKKYDIVGLVDDRKEKIGCRVSGIKVLGDRSKITKICKEQKIDVILLAIPSISVEQKKEILDICNRTKCKVRILPGVNELIHAKRFSDHIRQPQVADLLCRKPVSLNNEVIGSLLRDHVVLVTGGGGSIGSELCRQIAKHQPKKLLILDIYENNAYDIQNELKAHFPDLDLRVLIASVRERKRIEEIFATYRPSLVFHAAAHKHVPLMEDDPREAVKNNVFGTLNVAECADKYGVSKFVLISTDKAVNPTNVMGATKRICEMIVQSLDKNSQTEFAAVRFGNVLGSNGSVIPLFKRQIAEGGPVTVTHKDITRFFMTIPEAAQLVLQAASYASGGEIFVLDMGEPVKIYDLATNLIRLSGLEVGKDIEIEVTGLRPGEKLYEELMMETEGLTATENEKIFIMEPVEEDLEMVRLGLSNLDRVVQEGNDAAMKEAVSAMVSTYSIDRREETTHEVTSGITAQ
ncbi:MAG: polysaccharide biosynthesis protein, partial [Clostridia bacterium]|nr:polysaccharide biosynthesis protein [Clostridia bacterium]